MFCLRCKFSGKPPSKQGEWILQVLSKKTWMMTLVNSIQRSNPSVNFSIESFAMFSAPRLTGWVGTRLVITWCNEQTCKQRQHITFNQKLTPTQIIRMFPSFTILQDQLHAGADWHCYLGASGTGAAPPGHVGGRYVGRWGPPWPLSSRSSGAGPYLPLRRISSCPPPPLTGGRFMVCHPPEREPVHPW